MNTLTLFGACAVTVMLIAYTLENRSPWWILIFAWRAPPPRSMAGCQEHGRLVL